MPDNALLAPAQRANRRHAAIHIADRWDMWNELLWLPDGSPRRSVIQALAQLLSEEAQAEFVDDMVEMLQDLESQGHPRELIVQWFLQELRVGASDAGACAKSTLDLYVDVEVAGSA